MRRLLPGMLLILFTPLLAAPDCVNYDSGAASRVDTTDCVANLQECLNSDLWKVPGAYPGRSVCIDCEEVCRARGRWPDRQWEGKDCRWWLYQTEWAVTMDVDAGVNR